MSRGCHLSDVRCLERRERRRAPFRHEPDARPAVDEVVDASARARGAIAHSSSAPHTRARRRRAARAAPGGPSASADHRRRLGAVAAHEPRRARRPSAAPPARRRRRAAAGAVRHGRVGRRGRPTSCAIRRYVVSLPPTIASAPLAGSVDDRVPAREVGGLGVRRAGGQRAQPGVAADDVAGAERHVERGGGALRAARSPRPASGRGSSAGSPGAGDVGEPDRDEAVGAREREHPAAALARAPARSTRRARVAEPLRPHQQVRAAARAQRDRVGRARRSTRPARHDRVAGAHGEARRRCAPSTASTPSSRRPVDARRR